MAAKDDKISLETFSWQFGLLIDKFYISVKELITVGAGDDVGVEFEGKINDRILLDSICKEGLNIINENCVSEFKNLIWWVDFGQFIHSML